MTKGELEARVLWLADIEEIKQLKAAGYKYGDKVPDLNRERKMGTIFIIVGSLIWFWLFVLMLILFCS